MNTWQSVRAEVLARIRSGEWAPGGLIPTEHELARELGCARATVNRALRDLADSGIVERRRKVGTRVATTPSRRTTLEMSVIRHEIQAMGAHYRYEMTRFETLPAPSHVADALQVRQGDPVLSVKTQHFADNRTHCCEVVWLNPAVLPDIDRRDLEREPPHEWLGRNVALTQGQFTILAEGATGDCARSLDVRPGTPVLAIERISWSDLVPVSFARQFYGPGHRLVSED
ncbi:GntR family transcriptional regulator (plasmid) [Paracoccus sp. TK19116]|uniref:GntR family transcriptional regulator n=1 Tax=Paracoccus albicereus TaxID=2922394 RepID=A0ABT1MLC7_9RHOB|nr:UTRA domain-containing protein [Paracoccus albicereus]MCQ0969104.1 GntR family transcriptional regulator [Paracoccus albicereus]